MKRPPGMPRDKWFRRRRGERNRDPLDVVMLAKLDRSLARLARHVAHAAQQPNPVFAAFAKFARKEPTP